MTSKSWTPPSAAQCQPFSRQLGRHTDPIISAAGDCRFDGRKTSKRNSEESLQRASKRSRTSQSPSDSANTASSASACTGPPDSSGETSSLSRLCSGAALVPREKRTSSKKTSAGESKEGPRKRGRGSPSQTFKGSSSSQVAGGSTPASISWEAVERKSSKRKSEDTEGPRKRSRKTPSPSEGPSHQAPSEASSSHKPGSSSSGITAPPDSRAAFEAKYEEGKLLGAGGFGSVFAGHRKADKLPVAIKHIPQTCIQRTSLHLDGNIDTVPLEVALLLKLKPAAAGTSAVIALLDWYNVDDDLILVLERPVPCMDLLDYITFRSYLQEHEAKTITKQLVDALIDVHSKGVFHRDIKPENILIETGSDVPRIRIIDFGCGTFLSERKYTATCGTDLYFTPECCMHEGYRAEPTNVWQVGVVLFGMLHGYLPFQNRRQIVFEEPDIRGGLSLDCQDFLRSCLTKSPDARPSLETLKHHPWLT